MQTLATYSTPAGERELVLVCVPDATPPLMLFDVAADVRAAEDADARIVEDELFTPDEARALVTDYLQHNGHSTAPAEPVSPWEV